MRPRLVLNVVLALVVAVLALLVVYQPGKKAPPDEPPLANLKPADIDHIELLRSDQPNVDLVRKNGQWLMTGPYSAPANAARVREILGIPAMQVQSHVAGSGKDLSRFGLAKPEVRVRLGDHEFAFGNTNPLTYQRYVGYAGQVYLVNDTIYAQLIATPPEYVSNRLLPAGTKIDALTVPDLALVEHQGRWKITLGSTKDVSADAITTIIQAWQSARALQVTKLGDKPAQGTATLGLKNGKKVDFSILAVKPQLVLGRKDLGLEYHLDSDAARRLLKLKTIKQTAAKKPHAAAAQGGTASKPDTAGGGSH